MKHVSKLQLGEYFSLIGNRHIAIDYYPKIIVIFILINFCSNGLNLLRCLKHKIINMQETTSRKMTVGRKR